MRALTLLLCALPLLAQEPTIALVGLDHAHAWGHLEAMIKGSQAKLVAIAETDAEMVAEARKLTPPHVRYYTDYRKMLDEVRPTMVWAFVENNRHHEVVQACGPRKIHVIFEKPLAATAAQAAIIRDVARKHGIQVLTNFGPAYDPAIHAIKEQLVAGELGKPWRMRATTGHGGVFPKTGRTRSFHEWLIDPEKNGGGALMDFGCYNVLYALYYLGRPTSVYAYALHLRPGDFPKVEDGATILLEYPNAVAILEQSWDLPPNTNGIEIVTYSGALRLQGGKAEMTKGRSVPSPLELGQLAAEHAGPIADMVASIRSGRPVEGLVSLDYTVAVAEILDAAKVSVKTGKRVAIAR